MLLLDSKSSWQKVHSVTDELIQLGHADVSSDSGGELHTFERLNLK